MPPSGNASPATGVPLPSAFPASPREELISTLSSRRELSPSTEASDAKSPPAHNNLISSSRAPPRRSQTVSDRRERWGNEVERRMTSPMAEPSVTSPPPDPLKAMSEKDVEDDATEEKVQQPWSCGDGRSESRPEVRPHATRSFHRLLAELAAEHRREVALLRRELDHCRGGGGGGPPGGGAAAAAFAQPASLPGMPPGNDFKQLSFTARALSAVPSPLADEHGGLSETSGRSCVRFEEAQCGEMDDCVDPVEMPAPPAPKIAKRAKTGPQSLWAGKTQALNEHAAAIVASRSLNNDSSMEDSDMQLGSEDLAKVQSSREAGGFWTRADALGSARLSPFDWTSSSTKTRQQMRPPSSEEVAVPKAGKTSLTREQSKALLMVAGGPCKPHHDKKKDMPERPGLLWKIVHAPLFDSTSCCAIVLNAILLGVAANMQVKAAIKGGSPDEMPYSMEVVSVLFTCFFTTEVAMRLVAGGCRRFFFGQDWSWNLFDCGVVGSDLIQLVLEVFSVTLPGGISVQKVTAVRMLRILRITRVVRVVRLIRFFRELRMMISSLLRSGSSLLWSLLLLSLTMYIFSIYFSQILAYHVHGMATNEAGGLQIAPNSDAEKLVEMFGSLIKSLYTLYLAVSGGVSWGEIASVLMNVDVLHGVVLCFYTFFTTFALLNIITGIFVDSSISCAKNERDETIEEQMYSTKKALQEIEFLFEAADKDDSGTITLEEFEATLENPKVWAHMSAMGIEADKAKGLFRLLDLDDSGEVSIQEFVMGCFRLKGNAKSIDLATLMYENKRMAHRMLKFFAWCEAEFLRRKCFEVRMESTMQYAFGMG